MSKRAREDEAAPPEGGSRAGGVATVAHLGGVTSFTHLAAVAVFGGDGAVVFSPADTIADVFGAVRAGSADCGVVPIESSANGSFNSALDELLRGGASSNLKIIGERVMMCEKLALCVVNGAREIDIDRVCAHPHILEVCSDYLRLLDTRRSAAGKPKLERVPALDSVKSCAVAAEDPVGAGRVTAAISNRETATRFGLQILCEHIGSDLNGSTRYIIVANSSCDPLTKFPAATGLHGLGPRLRGSLAFGCANQPASIFKWSSAFAFRNINIIKVECRPSTSLGLSLSAGYEVRNWDTVFLVDYEVPVEKESSDSLINSLREREFTTWMRDLGSYSSNFQDSRQAVKPNPIWQEVVDVMLA